LPLRLLLIGSSSWLLRVTAAVEPGEDAATPWQVGRHRPTSLGRYPPTQICESDAAFGPPGELPHGRSSEIGFSAKEFLDGGEDRRTVFGSRIRRDPGLTIAVHAWSLVRTGFVLGGISLRAPRVP
jgi:hypothetical protein